MNLDELILQAGEGDPKAVLTMDAMATAAESLGIDQAELCDRFARRTGEGFLSGEIPWIVADIAMNKLFAYCVVKLGTESDLVWSVYIAFDQSEFRHKDDPPEFDHTRRTRDLLQGIL